ncbi:MAG: glucose-6-phosphate dehydrogenase, partial [Thiogranum sp.]|nr:glucose-6-phosphate dehydrogenase [Thiogranum sp.]
MDDCTYVIFGATGNLSQVKLIPALYDLEAAGRLPPGLKIVGFGRRGWSDDDWREKIREWLGGKASDPAVVARFCARQFFFQGNLDDQQAFPALRDYLLEGARFSHNLIFYMAVAPADFGPVSHNLGAVGLCKEDGGWRRLVVEKPFGYDLESAESLNRSLSRDFDESQIFRIDHYLGKG